MVWIPLLIKLSFGLNIKYYQMWHCCMKQPLALPNLFSITVFIMFATGKYIAYWSHHQTLVWTDLKRKQEVMLHNIFFLFISRLQGYMRTKRVRGLVLVVEGTGDHAPRTLGQIYMWRVIINGLWTQYSRTLQALRTKRTMTLGSSGWTAITRSGRAKRLSGE